MHGKRKIWTLAATLAALAPVTIVCDVPELSGFFRDLDIEVYYEDDYDRDWYYYDYYYEDYEDDWWFDFDWWW